MCVGARGELPDPREVEHVALLEREVRVLRQLRPGQRVAVEVVHRHHLVLVDEPARERRADEARPARDEDSLAAQSHAASLDER